MRFYLKYSKNKSGVFYLVFLFFLYSCQSSSESKYADWTVYGGSSENIKYSSLNQIDTSNVDQLEIAWIYHSEDNDSSKFGPIESNPIIIEGILYGASSKLKLFAIDARTGEEQWKFDPADSIQNPTWQRSSVNMNRGVSYWEEGDDKRIIYTVGPIVFAVDASTGKLIQDFGEDGGIDLRKGLGRNEDDMYIVPTSPVAIYKDLFFVSGLTGGATPGHIRGFNVKTGEQKWIFHTIPHPGEQGYETWEDSTAYSHMGGSNSWSGFSLDQKRGLLFAGTGTPSNDFYGGKRLGDGLYGNTLLAIKAETGELAWHFQTVHHDVWDMDLSSPPALVTLDHDGKKVDAAVLTTKTGFVFVFDRETGEPLFPIEERTVPTDEAADGEKLSPTQPFSSLPAFARQKLTSEDLNPYVDEESYAEIKSTFEKYRHEGIFTPPSEEGTIVFPGYDGGGEWGGPTVDPETNMLYVNANEMAWLLNIVKNEQVKTDEFTNLQAGQLLYKKNCMSCHGPERKGSGNNPTLIGVKEKINKKEFGELLSTGRRMMPGFAHLDKDEVHAIATFVLEIEDQEKEVFQGELPDNMKTLDVNYSFTGYNKFLTKEGYPAISPPWGTLNAINLNTGEFEWKVPLGEFEELKNKGVPPTGRENYGGSVVTAGGVLFIGASADGKFRAFNKRTGDILWETELPAPGVATPATYAIDNEQYVVIACGGSKWGGKSSDAYVAFKLPNKQ